MAARERPELSGVPETLLVTLHAKAVESRSPRSVLRDHFADALVALIDYDFARLRTDGPTAAALALRARYFDRRVRAFIAAHPDGVVLNLGCGLDTRPLRVDPPPGIAWFDVDLPQVIAVRQRLFPPRPGVQLIGASVLEHGWLTRIPAGGAAIVVAEGLLLYLAEADVHALLRRLMGHFGCGEVVFDGYSPLALRLLPLHPGIGATGARGRWGLRDGHALARAVPGLELREQTPIAALADTGEAPAALRALALAGRAVPLFGRLGRVLSYRF